MSELLTREAVDRMGYGCIGVESNEVILDDCSNTTKGKSIKRRLLSDDSFQSGDDNGLDCFDSSENVGGLCFLEYSSCPDITCCLGDCRFEGSGPGMDSLLIMQVNWLR